MFDEAESTNQVENSERSEESANTNQIEVSESVKHSGGAERAGNELNPAHPEHFKEMLETFPNPHPLKDYVSETVCPEFTSMCPKTGQPDFGQITITYIPDRLCYELKSLKLYLQQYRNHGAFYEHVTNCILDDLVAVVKPRSMQIRAEFTPRGGIRTTISTEYIQTPE